ncbi:hypothetical protein PMAYCL1PPCAC_25623, partial [Pristionchus mayeri]
SGVFIEGGFKWSVLFEKNADISGVLTLRCGAYHSEPWKCEAEVGWCHLRVDGVKYTGQEERFSFDDDKDSAVLGLEV